MGRTLGVSIKITGFDELLEKIESAGNSIDDACIAAVDASLPIVETAMKEGAARHRKGVGKYGTDAVYNAIESIPAVKTGTLIHGEVGIDTDKHPEAKHAVYEEYGDGHSVNEFPDPFIRPAVDNNKAKIRAAQKAVLKSRGVPLD